MWLTRRDFAFQSRLAVPLGKIASPGRPEDSRRQVHQDESGRLWDVLWMARLAGRSDKSRVMFQVHRVPRGGRACQPRLATLMVIGPGDDGFPVVTIMRLGED